MDCVVRGGEEDANSRPHCLNCHGAPNTQADSQENLIYDPKWEGYASLLDAPVSPFRPCKKDCSAESQWPDNLKISYPELQRLPFWVRSNFEKTLQKHRKAQGKAVLPFRFDLGEVEWEVQFKPRRFVAGVLAGGQDLQLSIIPYADASIRSQGSIQNNLFETGLKTFLDMRGFEIQVDRFRKLKNLGIGFRPEKLATDISGLLHLTGTPNFRMQQVIGFAGSFGKELPFAPKAFRYRGPDLGCYLFNQIPQCSNPSSINDFLLTGFLPEEIVNSLPSFEPIPGGLKGLPPRFLLEDLILKILTAAERSRKKPKDPKKLTALGNLFSSLYLEPGSYAKLSLKDLRDFFVPGILDLGPSQAEILFQVDADQNWVIGSDDFDLHLEAMDYPYPKKGKRGALRLSSGRIRPGPGIQVESHGYLRSGIHFTRHTFNDLSPVPKETYPWSKQILSRLITGNSTLEANLNLELNLGKGLSIQGQLLLHGELLNTPDGPRLAPDFYFALKDVQVLNGEGSPLVRDFNVELNSDPLGITWFQSPFKKFFEKNAGLRIYGTFKDGQKLDFQGSLGVPLTDSSAVDLENLLHKLDLVSLIEFIGKDGTQFQTHFNLKSTPVSEKKNNGEKVFPFESSFEITQKAKEKNQSQSVLKDGKATFQFVKTPENFYQAGVQLTADALHLKKAGTPGLHFHGVSLDLEIDQLEFSDELRTATFPKLDIRLNQKGSTKGGIQGPILLKQAEDKPFRISFLPLQNQWKVENVDLGIDIQKILLTPAARKIFTKGTRSLGLDGRLQVNFCLNTAGKKRNWNGEGLIQVLGDPQGDIYPLDWYGNKIGPPLFRNTRWQWKKISGFSPYGNYPLGVGHLTTWINLASFGSISEVEDRQGPLEYLGSHPFEFQWVMDYDNQPLTMAGFNARIEKYIMDICLDTPTCRSGLQQKRPWQLQTPEGVDP